MLRFIEGFDQYPLATGFFSPDASDQMLSTGWQYSQVCQTSSDTPHKRGQSIKIGTGISLAFEGFRRVFPVASSTLVVGFAIKAQDMDTGQFNICGFEYTDGFGNHLPVVNLQASYDGRLLITTGGVPGGSTTLTVLYTLGQTEKNILPHNLWCYLEVKVVLTIAAIHMVVRKNNNLVAVFDIPNVALNGFGDFPKGPFTQMNAVFWGPSNLNAQAVHGILYFDDMYGLDNLGGKYQDFITGLVSIYTLHPTTDAGPNQMTKVGGASTHASTQIDHMDEDTSYLWSNTVDDQEVFQISPLPPSAVSIIAVSTNVRAVRDSAMHDKFVITDFLGDGSTIVSDPYVVSTLYSTFKHLSETPTVSGGWTLSDINALKVGIQVTGS